MNYYDILELKTNASFNDIKKSYRKLAMKYHPDRNNGSKAAEEKFKLINEAYITLSHYDKKENYDDSLKTSLQSNWPLTNSFEDPLEDTFKNSNITVLIVTLEFWEAALGCEKIYKISLNTTRENIFTKISVKFEPAVNSGDLITIKIDNHIVNLQINILDNISFERDNLDIYTTLEIPITTGNLGGKTIFSHWTKDLEISIPPGIKNGTKLRLANMGIKKNFQIGDLYLVINLIAPKKNKNSSLKKLWFFIFKKS